MAEPRSVVIYRERLLAASEPFISAQAEGLRRHRPWYLAVRRVDAHPLPAERDLRWSDASTIAPLRRYLWKRWAFSPATVKAIRTVGPVLVHAHFGRDAAQVLPLVRRLRVPLVVTFHGHDATRTDESFAGGSYSDRLFLHRRKELAELGARFLAVSSFVHERLLDLGFPQDRVQLHYIGVDSDAIARCGGGRRDPRLVLFTGRLVEQKGVLDLAAALHRLSGRIDGVRLVVVGDGPERVRAERAIASTGVPAQFLGFLPPEELWKWMSRAGAVVVPSRTGRDGWKEAFNLVAAEAQAAGAAVVASTCGGLPEAIAPANAAHVFPEGNVDALADRLAGVLERGPDDARAAAARAWIRAERDLGTQTSRLDTIYEEVAP